MKAQLSAPAAAALLTAILLAACHGGPGAHDDGYWLLRREEQRLGGTPARFSFASAGDPAAIRVRALLGSGFPAELLRTLAMARRFAARTAAPGSTVHRRAQAPTYVALGVSDRIRGEVLRDRVLRAGLFESGIDRAAPIIWLDDIADDIDQVIAGAGDAIVDMVAPERPRLRDDDALRAGYLIFLRAVAAEWRPPSGAAISADEPWQDRLRRDPDFAPVRAGDVTLAAPHPRGALIVAAVLHALAASKVGRCMADPEIYAPFLADGGTPPAGVHPALLLGAFRNFQAKLLFAWSRAIRNGRTPRDATDLVEAYCDAFPRERVHATRLFLTIVRSSTDLDVSVASDEATQRTAGLLAHKTAEVILHDEDLRLAVNRRHCH